MGISPPRSEALLCLPGWETGLKTKQKGRKRERGGMGRAGIPAPGGPGASAVGCAGNGKRSSGNAAVCAAQWGGNLCTNLSSGLRGGLFPSPLPPASSRPAATHSLTTPSAIGKTPIEHRSGIAGAFVPPPPVLPELRLPSAPAALSCLP